jgi:tRNA(fMet)-specific endonuclease VapC
MKPTPPLELIRRLAAVDPTEQATTSITVGELVYGACRSTKKHRLLAAIETLVAPNLLVLPFDEAAARTYGELRATLEADGAPLSEPDLRIAAIAIASDATLATGNLRHFAQIPGLQVEDWLADCR